MDWCKAPEKGLLRPDLVILLTLTPEAMSKRGGFGDERYEVPELQKKVMEKYLQLKDDKYWKVVDADKSPEDLSYDLYKMVSDSVHKNALTKLSTLW